MYFTNQASPSESLRCKIWLMCIELVYLCIIDALMRTNIDIDDQLMQKAMKLSKSKTKKEAVEQALKALILLEEQKKILNVMGKVTWEGNLAQMRND